ncbi:hypothetical protein [Variovorax sp. LT1R16]
MKLQTPTRRRIGEDAPGAAMRELAIFVTVIGLTLVLSFVFIA